jgi:hypothetical protein
LPPDDPLAGFLPPNDDSGRGEGHVSFSIRPRADLLDGTVISNQANIVFDHNAPIATNIVTNTIDARPPEVVGVWPRNGADDIDVTETIVVTLTETMNPKTLNLVVSPDVTGINPVWDPSYTILTVEHDPFVDGIIQSISINMTDLVGYSLATPYSWSFQTKSAPPPSRNVKIYLPLVVDSK